MNNFIFGVIVPLLVAIVVIIFIREYSARKEAEQELGATRKSLKGLCEACIKENNSVHARITYEAYFGTPVNLTGDGFIDGYE